MKIYTKKGDSGETSLFGGEKITKAHDRIEAYGTVDELNSIVGLVLSYSLTKEVRSWLEKIQEMLFVLGADLATPPSKKTRIDRLSEEEIKFLEKTIDAMEESLPPLKNFILPGGSQPGALLHFARTVCRRAERAAVRCNNETEEGISDIVIKFLNRLSDFFFVIARYENNKSGNKEKTWKPEVNK